MAKIERKFTCEPSNSKAPGAKRHLSVLVGGAERRFERGSMEVPEGTPITIRIGATWINGRRNEETRDQAEAQVVVTGDASDSVEIVAGRDQARGQQYSVRVTGVRAA